MKRLFIAAYACMCAIAIILGAMHSAGADQTNITVDDGTTKLSGTRTTTTSGDTKTVVDNVEGASISGRYIERKTTTVIVGDPPKKMEVVQTQTTYDKKGGEKQATMIITLKRQYNEGGGFTQESTATTTYELSEHAHESAVRKSVTETKLTCNPGDVYVSGTYSGYEVTKGGTKISEGEGKISKGRCLEYPAATQAPTATPTPKPT
ncbi:MAG: hypothetical protein JO347_05665 [Candidatus Eremiobacteraeota bacterium]|nr:hypothetical protein [Candidatus Eremiobacteraeota bacterium]